MNREGQDRGEQIQSVVRLLSILIPIVIIIGCSTVRSKTDVVGTFELEERGNKIVLVLSPSGRYSETIKWQTGKVEERTGIWRWGDGRIGFEGFRIPKEFAPAYIVRQDQNVGPSGARYTEPGSWSMSVERRWGRVVIP